MTAGVVAVTLLGLNGRAEAQQAPSAGGAEAREIEQVVVTGTRISSPVEERSGLVTAIEGQALRQAGNTALVDVLKQMPALVGSRDSSDAGGNTLIAGGTGLSLLNLRNLGVNRTLVLVDGRRHVGALSGTGAVEIDTIPIALIDRVEISTGGASAIYGADGVSGVVNFVTRRNFAGLEISSSFGQSSKQDAEDMRVSVLSGINFAEGKGNATVALEYAGQNRLRRDQRDFSSRDYAPLVGNPAEAMQDDPGVPDRIPVRDLRNAGLSPDGAADIDFDGLPDFNGDDTPFDFGSGIFGGRFQQGGDATPIQVGDLLPKKDRYTLDALLSYEFSRAARIFSDLKYSRTTAFAESYPTSDFFLAIAPDNPFIPPNIAAAAQANFGVFTVARTNFDLGIRNEDIERETIRSVLGVDGSINDNLKYEVSFVYGRADIDTTSGNNRLTDRFYAALDATIDPVTGSATCRSNLDPAALPLNFQFPQLGEQFPAFGSTFTPGAGSGCMPINVFGNGSISRAAAAWIMADSRSQTRIEQQVAQAFVSGNSGGWFSLPAGPLSFAAGIEWRKEESRNTPASEDQLGLAFNGLLPASRGEYDVNELFGELSVPLLRGLPFAHALVIDGAVRHSDYSMTGDATTWQSGLAWSPIPTATVRATVARATRAPNIAELFGPTVPAFAFFQDPCDTNHLNLGSSSRAANCAALLSSLGVDPTTYVDPNVGIPVSGQGMGNEDLEEERSKTHTIGIDWRPRAELVVSLGWYDIKLRDAVNTPLAQQTADACVDLPTLANSFCALIGRVPGTGSIAGFIEQPINIAEFRTEGYDFSLSYQLDPARVGWSGDWGTFAFSVSGNRLTEFTVRNLPTAPDESFRDAMDVPKLQTNLELGWSRGPLNVRYRLEYFDETQRIRPQLRHAEPDIVEAKYFDYDEKLTHDVYAQYAFRMGVTAYAGINNLTDEEPDTGEIAYPLDPRGRFFFVGLTYSPVVDN